MKGKLLLALSLAASLATAASASTQPQYLRFINTAGKAVKVRIGDPGTASSGFLPTYTSAASVAGAHSRADMSQETGVYYGGLATQMRNLAGTVVDATGGAGKFSVSTTATFGSPATLKLLGENCQNNTKTDVYEFEFRLPAEYVPGSAITVNVGSNVTGSGTLGTTHTLTVDAFKQAADGTVGANLGPAAGNVATGTAADSAFAITSTGLVPGNRLLIQVQVSINETGNVSPINANITYTNVALNIKG